MNWINVSDKVPRIGVLVDTRVNENSPIRKLYFIGNLWVDPEKESYVKGKDKPTQWRAIVKTQLTQQEAEKAFDEAPPFPLSEERIQEIVDYAIKDK